MPSAALRDERVSPASSPDHAAGPLASKRYEATPPPGMDLVEPGDTIATTKEEEWVTRKRSEVTTTRQIATRVQREVLLEDGRVVADSGPAVKTTTTQDVYTQEHHQTEQLALDQPSDSDSVDGAPVPGVAGPVGSAAAGTVRVVANPGGVVRESHQRRVVTHEQRDDVKETEEKYHLGDITDDAFVAAVGSTEPDGDIRKALKTNTSEQLALVERGPKLVKETTATKKTVDTEDTDELRALQPDGTIVTETKRTTEHEEVDDKDLPENEGASVASGERRREGRERAACVESEARTDLMAGGRRVGAHVHSRTRTHQTEKEGDPVMEDLYEWDSLSMRMRRQRRMRNAGADTSKDAYVKKPIDFDLEEETRKKETSKWLEHHFGSDSRSSRDSLADEPPRQGTSTAYFNVTIKSRADTDEGYCGRAQRPPPPVFASPPRAAPAPSAEGYFKGVSEWSQRAASPAAPPRRRSPRADDFMTPALTKRESPPGLAQRDDSAYVSSSTAHSPSRGSPHRGYDDEPPPGERTRHYEREEPAPDYSPPRERRASPSPPPARRRDDRKQHQRTRFAAESERRHERERETPAAAAPRRSVGGAIGDSIRKLVGRLRSASRERRRSPVADLTSRTYAPSVAVDAHIAAERPPQRYYLGEDPFAGSIYGREHKYEGASPRRNHDDHRSNFTSTLGRFSHSTSRLNPDTAQDDYTRSAQTLPRKLHGQHKKNVVSNTKSNPLTSNKRSTSAANVSVVHVTNGHHPQGPAKPARSYKALNRSKSFAMGAPDDETHSRYPNVLNRNYSTMYKSNPQFSRLDETPEQLKSPGIVSIINRSQRDLADAVSREAEKRKDSLFGSRYGKNVSYTNGQNVSYTNGHNKYSDRTDETDTKRIFMKGLRERAPELFHTLHADDDSEASRGSPRYGSTSPNPYNRDRNYSEDRKVTYKSPDSISRENSPYTPKYLFNDSPSRLRSPAPLASSPLRRGSNSSDNYSETYRYTTKSGDAERPTLTNTVETVSKKIIPSKDGRSKEIIQSRELNSVTTSRFRGEPVPLLKPAEKTNRYVSGFGDSRRGSSPLYSERRTNGHTVTERIRDYRH